MKPEEITSHVNQFIAEMQAKGANPLYLAHKMLNMGFAGILAHCDDPQAVETLISSIDEANQTAQERIMQIGEGEIKH